MPHTYEEEEVKLIFELFEAEQDSVFDYWADMARRIRAEVPPDLLRRIEEDGGLNEVTPQLFWDERWADLYESVRHYPNKRS